MSYSRQLQTVPVNNTPVTLLPLFALHKKDCLHGYQPLSLIPPFSTGYLPCNQAWKAPSRR
jgi:hypothetical protein